MQRQATRYHPNRATCLFLAALLLGGLLALVLTNDLHCLAFRPKIDLSLLEGRTGTEEPEV